MYLFGCLLADLNVRRSAKAIFRAVLPLLLTPIEHRIGKVDSVEVSKLRDQFWGKEVLVVGGTKGICDAIANVLRDLGGATVTCVGRSATTSDGGVSADLSTVQGCLDLVDKLRSSQGPQFSFIIFTVGAWPNFSERCTQEGIHKVVALDLVARHCILTRLHLAGLIYKNSCTVMSVLAAGQHYPSFLVGDSSAVKSRMKNCVLGVSE
mmetsp:Transcript_12532/g.18404  ORF Transcript_12532/g.18404 Transcript_12532/m.18404 type:complete len:208 (+) Transcript_12532:1470-2093(+)